MDVQVTRYVRMRILAHYSLPNVRDKCEMELKWLQDLYIVFYPCSNILNIWKPSIDVEDVKSNFFLIEKTLLNCDTKSKSTTICLIFRKRNCCFLRWIRRKNFYLITLCRDITFPSISKLRSNRSLSYLSLNRIPN